MNSSTSGLTSGLTTTTTNDDVDISLNKKYIIKHYYHSNNDNPYRQPSMTFEQQESAWKSFMIWIKNPLANGNPPNTNNNIGKQIIKPLLTNPFFCPISDKDIVTEILYGASLSATDRCFIILRLSQNERPLVWACAIGGTNKIIRVRIGVTKSKKNKTIYNVVLRNQETGELEIVYESPNLYLIMAHLHIHYAKTLKTFKWFEI